jgi:serine/threonine protein kinase
MDVYVQGKSKVTLTQNDFIATGGEGSIYVRGFEAYKIYHDPSKMIPVGKIRELSRITNPDVIKPEDILLSGSGEPIGYTMRYIKDSYPLCKLFPAVFRTKHGITPEIINKLVHRKRTGVQGIHDCSILLVDLNEMNFLVSSKFDTIYFIDVDSYGCPHYAAPVLMESVRDRHSKPGVFNEGTDWFSFAIVSFQMFTGIHPYKGSHPRVSGLDERMLANLSVLNKDVSVPPVCQPFDVIPSGYFQWYLRVLEGGERIPPPEGIEAIVFTTIVSKPIVTAGLINMELVHEYSSNIISYRCGLAITSTGTYSGAKRVFGGGDFHIARTTSGKRVAVWKQDMLKMAGIDSPREIPMILDVDDMFSYGGDVYVKQGNKLLHIELKELYPSVFPAATMVANVTSKSTTMFDGVAMQDALGMWFATILPKAGCTYNVKIPELKGYKVVDAKFERGVLAVVGEKQSVYDMFIFRFSNDYSSYDIIKHEDITYTGISMAVLDSGVAVVMVEGTDIVLFSSRKGSTGTRRFSDPAFSADMQLVADGNTLMAIQANRLYKLSMKQ